MAKDRHTSFHTPKLKTSASKISPKPDLLTIPETPPTILPQENSEPEPKNAEVLPKPKEKFRLPLLEVIFAVVLFGIQQGWAMSGFPPNIIAACVIWGLMLALLLHAFWKWGKTAAFRFSIKLITTILFVVIVVVGLWKPVLEEYRKEYPFASKGKSTVELKQDVDKFVSSLHNFNQRMQSLKPRDQFNQQGEDYIAAKTKEEKSKVLQRYRERKQQEDEDWSRQFKAEYNREYYTKAKQLRDEMLKLIPQEKVVGRWTLMYENLAGPEPIRTITSDLEELRSLVPD